MAIPNQVTRVAFNGRLAGGEIWESGFWLHSAPTSVSDANDLAATISSIFKTSGTGFMQQLLSTLCYPSMTWDSVKVYSYPAGGPHAAYVGLSTVSGYAGSAVATLQLPHQVAWCATYTTGAAGRSARGRSYWPVGVPGNTAATGQYTTTQMTPLVQALAQNLGQITISATPYQPVVVSQKNTSYRAITGVKCDSRLDIQRRRANREAIQNVVSGVVNGPILP